MINSQPEPYGVTPGIGHPHMTHAENYFAQLSQVLRRLPYGTVDLIASRLLRAYNEKRTVFLFGNGGSAGLASHWACDLGKGTALPGKRRLRVMALTDNIPTMTAWANDAKYDDIFAEQLRNFVGPGDVILAISGSGNSPNVINGLLVAKEAEAFTIGLTGYQGGKMKSLCDICLIVPSDNMQFIEDLHLCISHCVFRSLCNQFAMQANDVLVPGAQSYAAD